MRGAAHAAPAQSGGKVKVSVAFGGGDVFGGQALVADGRLQAKRDFRAGAAFFDQANFSVYAGVEALGAVFQAGYFSALAQGERESGGELKAQPAMGIRIGVADAGAQGSGGIHAGAGDGVQAQRAIERRGCGKVFCLARSSRSSKEYGARKGQIKFSENRFLCCEHWE